MSTNMRDFIKKELQFFNALKTNYYRDECNSNCHKHICSVSKTYECCNLSTSCYECYRRHMQMLGFKDEYNHDILHRTWACDGSLLLHSCKEHLAITMFLKYLSIHSDANINEFICEYCICTGEKSENIAIVQPKKRPREEEKE